MIRKITNSAIFHLLLGLSLVITEALLGMLRFAKFAQTPEWQTLPGSSCIGYMFLFALPTGIACWATILVLEKRYFRILDKRQLQRA